MKISKRCMKEYEKIVEKFWKEKWHYFAKQEDESEREYVIMFRDELDRFANDLFKASREDIINEMKQRMDGPSMKYDHPLTPDECLA